MTKATVDTMTYEEEWLAFLTSGFRSSGSGAWRKSRNICKVRDRGSVEDLAVSTCGRALLAVTYGDAGDLEPRANFNSVVSSWNPSNYVVRDERDQPVVFFIGPVHGHEARGSNRGL